MNIEAQGYDIQMNHNELWSIAFSVKASLINTLKTHWVNHQDGWEKNEKETLVLLETMFNALGRADIYDSIFKEAEKIFKEFNLTKTINYETI